MANEKRKELLTRQMCYESLCRMFSKGRLIGLGLVTLMFFGLTALSAYAHALSRKNDLFENLFLLFVVAFTCFSAVVCSLMFIYCFRTRSMVLRRAFLLVEDELKSIQQNVFDTDIRPNEKPVSQARGYMRIGIRSDRLIFEKTGPYMQRYGFNPYEVDQYRNSLTTQRPNYYTWGKKFYVVVLNNKRHKPLLIYNANDFEPEEPLDQID